jgi:hypothetical protein
LIVPLYQPPVQITLVFIVISDTSVNDVTLIKKHGACQQSPTAGMLVSHGNLELHLLRAHSTAPWCRLWSQTEH